MEEKGQIGKHLGLIMMGEEEHSFRLLAFQLRMTGGGYPVKIRERAASARPVAGSSSGNWGINKGGRQAGPG